MTECRRNDDGTKDRLGQQMECGRAVQGTRGTRGDRTLDEGAASQGRRYSAAERVYEGGADCCATPPRWKSPGRCLGSRSRRRGYHTRGTHLLPSNTFGGTFSARVGEASEPRIIGGSDVPKDAIFRTAFSLRENARIRDERVYSERREPAMRLRVHDALARRVAGASPDRTTTLRERTHRIRGAGRLAKP